MNGTAYLKNKLKELVNMVEDVVGIDCSDGWFTTIHKVSEEIEKKLDELQEIKEKQYNNLYAELPIPLGTKYVYYVDSVGMDVYRLNAEEITLRKVEDDILYTIDCYDFTMDDFGKIVFLSEVEAEQALVDDLEEDYLI